jgi:hypothetical protein
MRRYGLHDRLHRLKAHRLPWIVATSRESQTSEGTMSQSNSSISANTRRSIATILYEVFEIQEQSDSTAFLAALEKVTGAAGSAADEHDELAEVLSGDCPPPDYLSTQTLALVKVADRGRHDAPERKYGSIARRHDLMLELFSKAKELIAGDKERARKYARAAVLLAAQDSFPYGTVSLWRFVHDPEFEALSGWPAEKITVMRERLAEDRRQAAVCTKYMLAAGEACSALIRVPAGLEPAQVEAMMTALEGMAASAGARYELHLEHAKLVWKLANLARARGAQDVLERLRAAVNRRSASSKDQTIGRWLSEALSDIGPVPTDVGFKMVLRRQLGRLRRTAEAPATKS